MRIVILAALFGFMMAVGSFHVERESSTGAGPALAVGYLLLTAFFLGALFKEIRLPKLTGYLAAGLVAGESGLDLLPHAALDELQIFTGVAVALIALTAGTELEFRKMRPLLRSIVWITIMGVVGGAVILSAFILIVLSHVLPFMSDLGLPQTIVVSLVLGVVISAQSPAVVVALRTEMSADGPICRTVLGVVVIADLVVIVMFAASSTLANSVIGGEGGTLGDTILHLLWELGGSIIVGLGVGALIALFMRRVRDGAPLFVVMVAFVVAEVGARIGLDPLLVALAAGVLIRNGTQQGDALHHAIEGSSLPVYLVFFAVAGASIHIDVLAVVGLPAVALVILRGAVFLTGSRIAGRIASAPEGVRKWAGFGLLPQAGLALALSMLFAKTFPTFGAEAGALTLGIVAINEMVAPVLYRFALVKSGEAGGALAPSTGDAEGTPASDAAPSDTGGTTQPDLWVPPPGLEQPSDAYPALPPAPPSEPPQAAPPSEPPQG